MVGKEELEKLRKEAKEKLDSGKSISEVGSDLLRKGYKKEEVDEILKPFIKYDTPNFAVFSIIWGCLSVIFIMFPIVGLPIVLGGLFFAWRSKRNEKGSLWKVGLLINLAMLAINLFFTFWIFS